jgi:hypothetical protein
MMQDEVPDDFPADELAPFALSRPQLKFSLVEGVDCRFSLPGTEPGHRPSRYRECLAEVEWSIDLLAGKLLRPKYRAMPRDEILAHLRVTLVRDPLQSEAESDWILSRVTEAPRLKGTQ